MLIHFLQFVPQIQKCWSCIGFFLPAHHHYFIPVRENIYLKCNDFCQTNQWLNGCRAPKLKSLQGGPNIHIVAVLKAEMTIRSQGITYCSESQKFECFLFFLKSSSLAIDNSLAAENGQLELKCSEIQMSNYLQKKNKDNCQGSIAFQLTIHRPRVVAWASCILPGVSSQFSCHPSVDTVNHLKKEHFSACKSLTIVKQWCILVVHLAFYMK